MLNKPSAVIFAKNLAKLVSFYEQLVPMTVLHSYQDYTVLDSQTMQLVIHAIPPQFAEQLDITEPPELRTNMPIKLCIPVASLATARATAANVGGQLYAPEQEWQAGSFRACDGYDPEGNIIQFRETVL